MELRVERDIPTAAVELFLETGPRTIALSGGSTPSATYERLAGIDYPWKEVDVFFGDERCVPEDHPDSNLRMAREALLSRVPARAHPMTGCDPESYEDELRSATGIDTAVPRIDLVFLGLGEDGHTASLFPGDPALAIEKRWVALVERPDHQRMTLTLPVLSAATLALFLVSGDDKRDALGKLVRGEDIPAARVKAERVVVLADENAARGL